MKFLLDTNIILDIALQRELFYGTSVSVLNLIVSSRKGYITSNTITDIYYFIRKFDNHSKAIEFLTDLIQIIDVLGVDRKIIERALTSKMANFEDAIQVMSSEKYAIDYIVTRNIDDFKISDIKAITPQSFIDLNA
jgi:predicted nucleic acid-binding protein